jgi:hypothetical protein
MKKHESNRYLSRRRFLFAGLGGAAVWSPAAESDMKSVKITPGKNKLEERQSIFFELPALPGQIFHLVIPELISDTEENPLPWGHASPDRWEIGENRAAYTLTEKNVIRCDAEVVFHDERIEARVKVTNLSDRTWRQSNAFTCLLFRKAPLFEDRTLVKTYVPVGEDWKPLAGLFKQASMKNGLTFMPVAGGPKMADLWVGTQITSHYPNELAHGSICVVSHDGEWIAGMTAPKPAYVFNNAGLPCIHADPLLGDVPPGESAEAGSVIHIFKGSLKDFAARCTAD